MFKVIIQVSAYLENKGMAHVDVKFSQGSLARARMKCI